MADDAARTFGLTLAEALARFEAAGYTAQFGVVEGGLVRCYSCHTDCDPATMELNEILRVEGASDPDDEVAVVALTCPSCGCKGTLVLKYGAEATPEESEVLRALEDRREDRQH
jgi:hypothetical protein